MTFQKTVLVTGGTGFVGAALVYRLIELGLGVHLIVRKESDTWRIKRVLNKVQVHCVNLDDLNAEKHLKDLVEGISPNWVFHLAAHGAYSSQKNFEKMISTNIWMTQLLLNAVKDLKTLESLVYTGTSSEYGFRSDPSKEIDALDPNSLYAITKATGTFLCRHQAKVSQQRILIARLYNIYGPWEEPSRLMPQLVRCAMQGTLPHLVNPTISRDWVYVEDCVDALLRMVSLPELKPGAVFSICSGKLTTLKDLVEEVKLIFDIKVEPKWGSMPDRNWDTSIWVGNPETSQAQLGWHPKTNLREGLRMFSNWFREHPEFESDYRLKADQLPH